MRLGILIRDKEYRDALVQKLASYDNNIFVTIIENSAKDTVGCVILTDADPADIDERILKAISDRTVFLTERNDDSLSSYHRIFKYSGVSSLISELSLVYNEWHGTGRGRNYTSRNIAVICETDAYAAEKCMSLARQIIYRNGGKVLILPLSFINDYGTADSSNNRLSRLLYSIQTGRKRAAESFTYTDSYGVSYLMLPSGQNPLASLGAEDLSLLTSGLAESFDTLIFDIGTCFRKENLSIIEESDSIFFFGTGRRINGPEEIAGSIPPAKLMKIKLSGEADEAMALDDCVKQFYFTGDHNDEQSGYD